MGEIVLLVDFMYLWNRIYYAIGQSGDGDYYAHMKSIMGKLNNNNKYSNKYIILDGLNGTQRQKALLPEYKEGRGSKTEVYKQVEKFVKECSEEFPTLTFLRANNNEADEVIASLAVKFSRLEKDVYIYSGDKDLLQLLVYPRVHVGANYSGNFELKPFTEEDIQKKMDTIAGAGRLNNIGDLLKFRVFRGDVSDNISSVIPRFPSKVIIDLIANTWPGVTMFTDDVFESMVNYLPEKYSKQLIDNEEKLWRNWELMNLQFLPINDIISEVKRLS